MVFERLAVVEKAKISREAHQDCFVWGLPFRPADGRKEGCLYVSPHCFRHAALYPACIANYSSFEPRDLRGDAFRGHHAMVSRRLHGIRNHGAQTDHGRQYVLCWYVGQVPGGTIKEKRRTLIMGGKDSLEPLVQQHGWCVKLADGDCLVVPTGFIIISLCNEEWYGMPWWCSFDENDRLRTVGQLGALLQEFGELRAPTIGYPQFYDFLKELVG